MSDVNNLSGSPEYDTTSTVSRSSDEAYKLDVWLLSGNTTPQTRAFTYDRTAGLYKLSADDFGDGLAEIDEVIQALQEKYGAVDEPRFDRPSEGALEIMVDVVDSKEVAAYDSEFDNNSAVVYVTPENDPELLSMLDTMFNSLESVVSD